MRGHRLTLLVLLGLLGVLAAGCGGGSDRGSAGDTSARTDARPIGAGPAGEFHPVAGTFKRDDTQFGDCKGDSQCVEQAFGNVSFDDGPKRAIALFKQKTAADKAIEANCHRIVHTIGSAALARYDGNVAKAFAEGDSVCWSGYYHGILERAFAPAKTEADMGRIARTVCEDKGVRANTYIAYQCVHGLGHGLMIQSGYNLPLSLKICDALATGWDRTSCTGGVFMENISSSYGFKSRWLRDSDPVYPCNVVAKRHKTYCYLMVTSRILELNKYDFGAAAKVCSTVEAFGKPLCYQSLGRDASGFTRQDAGRIRAICAAAAAGRQDCVYGAARDIVSNDAATPRAIRLCNGVLVADRGRCFEGIGTIVGTLEATEGRRRRACVAATENYLAQCLRGAGVATAA